MYSYDEVYAATLEYFNGDELATNVFFKYALQDQDGNYLEKTPDDMHRRLSSEFARIEKKFGGDRALSEEEIYKWFKGFKYICCQGSPMAGIGNNYSNVSLSNCNVVRPPSDSMSDIFNTARDMANLYKRRYGVGTDLSNLRPSGAPVSNSAKYSSGAYSFADLYSFVTRIVGQCIAKGQKVFTKRGLINIENMGVGDEVWTKIGWVPVDRVLSNGKKEIFRLTTDSGFSIDTSKDHIFVTENNGYLVEKKLSDFRVGDSIVLIPGSYDVDREFVRLHSCEYDINNHNKSNRLNTNVVLPSVLDEKLSYFLGYTLGDGCVEKNSKGSSYVISLACANDWPQIKFVLSKIINELFNYDVVIKDGDGGLEKLMIFSRLVIEWLRNNDLLKNKSHSVVIPDQIYISPLCSQVAFLAGLFDADGYAGGKKCGYVFSTVSVNLAKGIQLLLMSMGIYAKIQKLDRSNKGWRDLYRVSVVGKSAQEKFVKLFSSVSIKVEQSLHISKRDNCLTPYKAESLGISHNSFEYIPGNSQYISAQAYERVKKEANLQTGSVLVKDKVLSIESVGLDETYDLSLPKEHLFFCQGFQVHNSGRRGALMLSMDVEHPDIEKFVAMKKDLTKVTGANISVKLNDEFMQSVKNDSDFVLRWPIGSKNPVVSKTVKARNIWNIIVETATQCAEPGLLFWDTILKNLPAQEYKDLGFAHYSTNPCAELPLSEDSCRLISQCLKHFVVNPFTKDAYFDFDMWAECVRVGQRLSDDLVELELEKLDNLIDVADTQDEKDLFCRLRISCANGRRTGLGTHGLADALSRLCLSYDSDEAIDVAGKIYEVLRDNSYYESMELAKERGAFPVWDWEVEKNNLFLQRLPKHLIDDIKKCGRRNISNLTVAPTGSVSILAQCSSGLEPVFKNSYIRRRKLSYYENDIKEDFIDDIGDRWIEFEVFHHNVMEWMELNQNEKLPEFFVEAGSIDYEKRIKIQSVIGSMIDHSISSTINLPRGTTAEVVGNIYMKAWESGLKGVTVYVDGSRSGVLVDKNDKKQGFGYIEAPDRPEELECDIHAASIKGEKWIILVGLMDGRPYEVFGGLSENIEIPPKYKKGTIIKVTNNKNRANRYDLRLNGLKIKNIIKMFDNTTYQVHTRMVSLGLRHGAKPSFLVEQLLKDPDNDLTSFSKVLARVLKKYIENGTKVTGGGDRVCPECHTDNLIYQEGCVTCTGCGWSRCS
jgi:ribonucleoside-diphosphate reductase alpha chain